MAEDVNNLKYGEEFESKSVGNLFAAANWAQVWLHLPALNDGTFDTLVKICAREIGFSGADDSDASRLNNLKRLVRRVLNGNAIAISHID